MTCTTVCAAAIGAATGAVIVGGSYALIMLPVELTFSHQPDIQREIQNRCMMVTLTAATVGASLGVLAIKAARFAYQRVTEN